jgi:PKD repeat protein
MGTTLAVAALTVTPALAAPVWTPPQNLSLPVVPATVPTNAQVAIDAAGNATAIWTELSATDSVVNTATHLAGSATWSPPETLSTTGSTADPVPQIAVNATGAAVAVWVRFDGEDSVVQSRRKSTAAGTWSAPQDLSTSVPDPAIMVVDEGEAQGPQVAINSSGAAVATWWRNDAANAIIQASRLSGVTWSGPVDVSAGGRDGLQSQVGIDGAGNATSVWVDFDGVHWRTEWSRLPAASSTWAIPQVLSTLGDDIANPQVAVNTAGDATAVWVKFGPHDQVQSASRSFAGATWSAVETLTAPDGDAADPQVSIDANGTAIAVWSETTAFSIIQSRRRASGTWSATASLSAPDNDAFAPVIAVNEAGAASAAWVTGQNVIQSSTIAVASPTWSAPTDRSLGNANCDRPSVAMNAGGSAVSAWTTDSGTDVVTQASLFDVTPPSIITMDVPATGQAGTPVAMAATIADNGSGLGPTSWDFGDGTRATAGPATTHTYTAPGTFTITLTPVNSFGGTATQQRQITIAPVPPPPPPPAPRAVATVTLSNVSGSCVKRPKRTCQARVAFRLDTPATVTLTLRKAGGKLVGRFTRSARAGANVMLLPARIGRTKITRGKYRVAIRATIPTDLSNAVTTKVITVR